MANLSTIFPRYHPAMMEGDGSTGYYSASYTSAGNKVTVAVRFKINSFSGGGLQYLINAYGPGGSSMNRVVILALSNDYTDADRQDRLQIQTRDSSSSNLCILITPSGYLDGEPHTLFYEFDGDAGTASLIIDGVDADDAAHGNRVAPISGTLDTGASSTVFVGSVSAAPASVLNGDIGYIGMRDAGGLTWSDFMHPNGNPKALDESGWTEWGAQPLFWNEHGDMENNLGSGGNMTRNGTIVVGKGGN